MTEDDPADLPTDRESPVGAPVIRGDRDLFGERADEAVAFDPDDPDDVAAAADAVRSFAGDAGGREDSVSVLRGAAACAALVRAEGSYKAAAGRASGDEEVTVSFVRKWARVHDLPYAVRKHVATGHIAPTAAKHVARVEGDARLALAWALLDGDLTVREVRAAASAVNEGADVEAALREQGVTPGRLTVDLPTERYLELRRRAALSDREPDDLVAEALAAHME